MAAKGGRLDFMFLAPPTRPLDPLSVQLSEDYVVDAVTDDFTLDFDFICQKQIDVDLHLFLNLLLEVFSLTQSRFLVRLS